MGPQDLPALASIFEDDQITLDPDRVEQVRQRRALIGEDGMLMSFMPGTPMGMMYRVYSGVATLAFALNPSWPMWRLSHAFDTLRLAGAVEPAAPAQAAEVPAPLPEFAVEEAPSAGLAGARGAGRTGGGLSHCGRDCRSER